MVSMAWVHDRTYRLDTHYNWDYILEFVLSYRSCPPKSSHWLWKRCDSAWGSPVIGNHFWYTIPVSWTQCQCYQSTCLTLGDYKPSFFSTELVRISSGLIMLQYLALQGPIRSLKHNLSSRINFSSECDNFPSHLRSTHDMLWKWKRNEHKNTKNYKNSRRRRKILASKGPKL